MAKKIVSKKGKEKPAEKKPVEKKAPEKSSFKVKQEVVVHNLKADEYYYGVIVSIGDKIIKVKHDDGTIVPYDKKLVFNKDEFESENEASTEADEADVDIDLDEDIDSAIVSEDDEEETEEEETEDDGEEETEEDETEEDETEEEEEEEEEETEKADVEEDDEEKVSSDAWYAVGDEHDADFKGPQQQTFRVWIPQDSKSRPFTIITPQPFTFKEHTVKMGGSFRNFFTCIAPLGQRCPLCESKQRPSVVKAFYVIDHTPYKSKAGKEMKDQVRLLVMKQGSYKIFRAQVDEYFEEKGKEVQWMGLYFTAKRTDADKAPATGDIFNIKGVNKVPDKVKKSIEDIQNEFVPLTRKAMLQQVNLIDFSEDGDE